jgi:hypothetical protein
MRERLEAAATVAAVAAADDGDGDSGAESGGAAVGSSRMRSASKSMQAKQANAERARAAKRDLEAKLIFRARAVDAFQQVGGQGPSRVLSMGVWMWVAKRRMA